jgi:hypothetical protein
VQQNTRDLDWESTLTDKRIEYAYGLAKKMLEARNEGWAQIGYRAAVKKDARLFKALERMAESTNALQERQIGQLMRGVSATHGEAAGTTEHQLCREAYNMMDNGIDSEGTDRKQHFIWIYGAAAWLCGYNA